MNNNCHLRECIVFGFTFHLPSMAHVLLRTKPRKLACYAQNADAV